MVARRNPHGSNIETNSSMVRWCTGSAPFSATSHELKSSLARCSGVVRRTHWSYPKFGLFEYVPRNREIASSHRIGC